MKRLLLAAIILTALAGSALAADLPPSKAPPSAFAPPPLWTGLYLGLNAGGSFSENNQVRLRDAGGDVPAFLTLQSVGAVPTQASADYGGFIGGGQIGYNYQWNPSFVVGLEADVAGLAGSANNQSAVGVYAGSPFSTSVNRSLDYLGTVRGRIGFLFTPTLLVYGAGGFAYAGTNLGLSLIGPAPFTLSTSYSDTRGGWTMGGGAEWLFVPNWSAKAEYLYYDVGSAVAPAAVAASGGAFDGLKSAAKFNGHVIRAGVNYHFSWGSAAPVVSK
jgi:outer membrane immunogenic protein